MTRILSLTFAIALTGCNDAPAPTTPQKPPGPPPVSQSQRVLYAASSVGHFYDVTTDCPQPEDDKQAIILLKTAITAEGSKVSGEIFGGEGRDPHTRRYTVITDGNLDPRLLVLWRKAEDAQTTYDLHYTKDPKRADLDAVTKLLSDLEASTVKDDKEARVSGSWAYKTGSVREVLVTVRITSSRTHRLRKLGG